MQAAGLNANKKILISLGAFACGIGGTKKAFGGFGGFDAWQTAGFNANKKLLIWALVPLPAGLGVPKRRLEGLERLKPGKRQASTPI